jgi:hypothetical protein
MAPVLRAISLSLVVSSPLAVCAGALITAAGRTTAADHCTAVELSLNGDTITLNTDGSWTIPSWGVVEKMAHNSLVAMQQCMARELLLRRSSIRLNDHPKHECPAGWMDAWKANPIVKACQKFNQPDERGA